jgi:NAD(P)-dependent dehydrogenase (short-subunit alcohol dehydrogenase family)
MPSARDLAHPCGKRAQSNKAEMKTVVVTGAGSGIGAATCRRLWALGHDLVIHTGHRREAVEALARQCPGVRCRVVVGDLAQPATVAALTEAAQALGALTGVVANAGFADKRSLAQLDDKAMESSLQTMVVALAHLMRATLPLLASSGQGRFVALSSFVAHRFTLGASTFPATAAAKAGIEALVKAAAVEYAGRGVTVNAVAPGYVRKDNPQTSSLTDEELKRVAARVPVGRLATPDDIAAPIAFLLSPEAAYITGQVLRVDGGITL